MKAMEPEFYPEGASWSDRSGFCAEISLSWDVEGWFDVVFWRRGNGVNFQIPQPTIEKARRFARVTYALLLPDFVEGERVREIRRAKSDEQMRARHAEQNAAAETARAERMAKITPETERVEKAVCQTCDHVDDPEEFEQPVYECSRCGGTQTGEGENRCETDHIFMAKVADLGCPSCGEAVEGELELVSGVEVDGEFIPESEIEVDNPTSDV